MKSHLNHRGRVFTVATLLGTATAATMAVISCTGGYGGGSSGDVDFLDTGNTQSHFRAIQVDPRSEDSSGPQFVVAGDLNADGLTDLVSAWNQSQPVQIHLQGRSSSGAVTFETITLAGSIPAVAVAGLAVTTAENDFDGDGSADIAVMLKETLVAGPECLNSELPPDGLSGLVLLYLGPADPAQANQALAWEEVDVGASFLQGAGDTSGPPEVGGYTAMAVADMDQDNDLDIVVAWNSDCGDGGSTDVVIFSNGGPAATRDGTWISERIPDAFPKGTAIKDIALGDIDGDSDLDVVATFPDAPTMNVRWYRNPLIDIEDDYHYTSTEWQTGMVAQIATGADVADVVDVDKDGILDVLVRSSAGGLVQWFKGPNEGPTSAPVRSIPWQVYTLAEFVERVPEAIAVADLNNDGQVEVIVSAEGGLAWFDSTGAQTVYDQWTEHLIIDDTSEDDADPDPATTDPNVMPVEVAGATSMNSILVVDLDADGANDLIVPFDRSGLSGLSNDALVWFQNTNP
ncbi:MAG: VCBS repeat-containing protein [Phycisphaerales bacterium]|nr:MAG: VCBS repeat-containing protein [Phycisphaerales bacterium]